MKVNSEVATGTGPNKKVAKRNAAEAMLLQLGYKASTGAPNAPEVTDHQFNRAGWFTPPPDESAPGSERAPRSR